MTVTAQGTQQAPAGQLLTADQVTFSKQLAAQTGLDPNVIAAWVLQEGGSSTGGRFNYLNIGNTDSGARNHAAFWNSNPTTAATMTAQWLKGKSPAGYTHAAPGITAILSSAGKSPQDQIIAIQQSPWAKSHEPELGAIWDKVLQTGGTSNPNTNASESVPTSFSDPSSNLPANPLSSITGAVTTLVGDVTDPQFWLRAAFVLGGGALIVLGLMQLSGTSASSVASKVPV